MARISEEFLNNVAAAWIQFKKGQIQETYVSYGRESQINLNFVMQKSSWYYGQNSYATFDCGHYVCSWTEQSLDRIAKTFFPGEFKEEVGTA